MRYRMLSDGTTGSGVVGDYRFGHGQGDFYINQPEAVAQATVTRLGLYTGDWFLDLNDGMPWRTKVLGKFTGSTRDPAIRARVKGTPGLKSIMSYSSSLTRNTRAFTVQMKLDTVYGPPITVVAGPNGDVRYGR